MSIFLNVFFLLSISSFIENKVAYPFADLNQSLLSMLLSKPQYGDEDSTYEQSKRIEAKTKVKLKSNMKK